MIINVHTTVSTCMYVLPAHTILTVYYPLSVDADFTSGPFEATFNTGETVATVSISTKADECAEPLETFKIMLQQTTSSEALGVVFGSPSEANVTIDDPTGTGLCALNACVYYCV